MTQDTSTYYVWIGGSCDYGHKERAGGAAVVIEHNGNIISEYFLYFCRYNVPTWRLSIKKLL